MGWVGTNQQSSPVREIFTAQHISMSAYQHISMQRTHSVAEHSFGTMSKKEHQMNGEHTWRVETPLQMGTTCEKQN